MLKLQKGVTLKPPGKLPFVVLFNFYVALFVVNATIILFYRTFSIFDS